MLAMIQDLKAYARGERSYARDQVRMRDVLEDVEFFGLRPLETVGTIRVERRVDTEGTFVGDQRALSRAILNIIRNAAEEMASRPGTLIFEAGIVDGRTSRFVVADTGRGIPGDRLPTLFEPFSTYGKSGGTGLGMAMTKATVDAHDGEIRIESAAGTGTRFTIMIPV